MIGILAILILVVTLTASAQARLKIVVIQGEDAVNIIQQKTAVAPIVEVRDRNDNPVAGALVTFSIQGGQNATFGGGLQSLMVTTNAAGRAAVTGLTPTASGAFQISASAAFQGETAVATIAQTNVMTAAQAAQIAGASGAGGTGSGAGAGGVAAGGGGALSATTIGIIGGAAAGGGLLVATKAGGDDSGEGPLAGRITETFTTAPTLLPDGGVVYLAGVQIPIVVVKQAGQVDATATFSPTADCSFVFRMCRGNCASSDLTSQPGRGPTLTVSGTLPPDSYQLLVGARSGAVPLCTTVPVGGVAFPYTITVTHP